MKLKTLFWVMYHFIIYPMLFLCIGYLVMNAYGFISGKIAYIIFPNSDTLFEISKTYVTTSMIMVLLEYFAFSKKINNYMTSRMFGIILMLALYFIFANILSINIYLNIIIVYCNTLLTVYIQKCFKMKFNHFFGSISCVFLLAYLIFITYIL